jgi:hypothetical protein
MSTLYKLKYAVKIKLYKRLKIPMKSIVDPKPPYFYWKRYSPFFFDILAAIIGRGIENKQFMKVTHIAALCLSFPHYVGSGFLQHKLNLKLKSRHLTTA